jgi:hypothetical protein
MKLGIIRSFAVLAFALSAAACSSIQVVDHTPQGGTVALEGAHDGAREKAEQYMRAQCPFGYRILDETERRILFACKTESEVTQAANASRRWRRDLRRCSTGSAGRQPSVFSLQPSARENPGECVAGSG